MRLPQLGNDAGPLKLEAREWDNEYHCFNVIDDPDEQHNLGEQACAPLPDLARSTFHVMPNITPPGRPQTDWGRSNRRSESESELDSESDFNAKAQRRKGAKAQRERGE